MMKNYINENVKSTFDIANQVATGLHFSILNLGCLYGIFTLGLIKLIPGTEKFTTFGQIKFAQIAFVTGKKED